MSEKTPPKTPIWLRQIAILVALVAVLILLKYVFDRPDEDAAHVGPKASADHILVQENVFTPSHATASSDRVDLIVNLADDRDDLEGILEARYGFDLKLNSVHADDDNLFLVSVDAARADQLIREISAVPGVETAERDGFMDAFGVEPNDPLYMFQWHFDQVNAEEAWELATGKDMVVAVIDTGVAYEEGRKGRKRGVIMPDLKDTVHVDGYDFVDNDDAPYDQHGHGTHVAGTIAQDTDNDYGVAGLAYNAKIMPLRVLDGQGRGNFADVADAIRYAADNNAHVINLSLGSFVPSREVEKAVAYAHKKGTVVIAAAGNSGSRVRSYPAAFKHVVAVAATQYDKSTTFYSNYGKYIDVAAPGGNTMVDQNNDGKPDGVLQETIDKSGGDFTPTFALYMGTSMASPHVAAVAALIMEQGVTDPDEVERILKESAVQPQKGKKWNERYGHGIIDAAAAVKMAREQAGSTARCSAGCNAAQTSWLPGIARTGLAAFFALFLLGWLRRKDLLDANSHRPGASFAAGWALGAGALFALPLLLPFITGGMGLGVELLGTPFASWDRLLLGVQTPIFASILPILAAAGFFLGSLRGRHFTAGLAIGTGATLLLETVMLTATLAWLPSLIAPVWLAANGALALLLGYVALKRT